MSRQQCKLCGRAVKGRRRQAAPSKKAQCGAVAVAESCHVEVLLVIARGNCVQWLVVAAQALATFEAHRRQQRLQQQRGIPGRPALRVVPEDRRLHIWEAIGAQLACKSGSAARFGRPTRHWRRQAAATVAVRQCPTSLGPTADLAGDQPRTHSLPCACETQSDGTLSGARSGSLSGLGAACIPLG
jgi:hypothetical protein